MSRRRPGRRRQQSAGPRAIEAAQPDASAAADLAPEQPGDEEARDDEEHVHADEPAAHAGHVGVKEDNGEHRDRAQALDVRRNPFAAGGDAVLLS